MGCLLLRLTLLLLALVQATHCCVFCQLKSKNVERRFYRLCEYYQLAHGTNYCTKYPMKEVFAQFGLDVHAMKVVTEKTHRVLRVIEIKLERIRDMEDYWDWLVEVKLPEMSRELLCPPSCYETTKVINCSTCKTQAMRCWSRKTCYPEQMDLSDTRILLAGGSAISMVAGILICVAEFRYTK
ncbi:transmembrane protein 95 [Rhinatrema bivittatum]|uniref:transmembrane protein 95 n=1 Tax=Rhinatrema bivittatum TaxID=194408 RepID=UPI001125FA75|nr:transmembrane protein 95 [Rhinatrema bivittatum]